jgi:hypothetical protein
MVSRFLTPDERQQLKEITRLSDQKLKTRARSLVMLDEGRTPEEVKLASGASRRTLSNWIRQFIKDRDKPVIARLRDKPSGRPRTRARNLYEEIYEQFRKDYVEKFDKEPPPLDVILAEFMKSEEREGWSIQMENLRKEEWATARNRIFQLITRPPTKFGYQENLWTIEHLTRHLEDVENIKLHEGMIDGLVNEIRKHALDMDLLYIIKK